MGQTLYLECESGISGDMMAGALLDLGADEGVLRAALASLPVSGFDVRISRVKKSALDACDFDVVLDAAHDNHDHDMAYLYGHLHGEAAGHEDETAGGHDHHHHDDDHDHDDHDHDDHDHDDHDHEEHDHQHDHHHEHRGLPEIQQIIAQAALTPRAKQLANRIFTILADAEANVHGTTPDQVHFHEVGAVDSIVDIVSVAVCLDNLDIQDVIVRQLCEGQGTVRAQHGILPIPVPATTQIVTTYGIPLHIMDAWGEYVTPTGAAIVAAIRTSGTLPASFAIRRVGLGAGKRDQARPSLLRAMLIQPAEQVQPAATASAAAGVGASVPALDTPTQAMPGITVPSDQQDVRYKLETTIDDTTGEALGYTMERLFAAGARDANYTPVFMKKNRPAWQLNVICDEADIPVMEDIIFRETTTIGIRRFRIERSVLAREERTVQTPLGAAQVKVCRIPGSPDIVRSYPEYESVAALSRANGLPFQDVYQLVKDTANKDQ